MKVSLSEHLTAPQIQTEQQQDSHRCPQGPATLRICSVYQQQIMADHRNSRERRALEVHAVFPPWSGFFNVSPELVNYLETVQEVG